MVDDTDKKVTYAFFDVDGTVTQHNTMLPFLEYCMSSDCASMRQRARYQDYKQRLQHEYRQKSREFLNDCYYKNYKNMLADMVRDLGARFFARQMNNNSNFFNKVIVEKIKQHQASKDNIVFVSGGFSAILQPIADYLGVTEIVCIDPEIINGYYSGSTNGKRTINFGKVDAIQQRFGAQNINYAASYAYGDHISDVPMLSMVNNAAVINANQQLLQYANKYKWQIL